jgi:aminoglycoside phosphotransferase (APT) family kinase protein
MPTRCLKVHESRLRSSAVSTNGRKLLGAGREAEVFEWDEGRVLRLARDPSRTRMVEREALALEAAHAAGAPVPAVYGQLLVDGRPGVVIDRVDGPDLLQLLGRRPWRLRWVASTLGREHAEIHGVRAPDGLPSLRDDLRARLQSSLVPEDVRARALERLDELPDGDRLIHGDFHPANVLCTSQGCVVIDWTNGSRGDPAADVARTLLMAEGADVSEDPWAVQALARVARRSLVAGYLRSYELGRPLDRGRVARWRAVMAAARLAEDIEPEREYLLLQAR